METKLSKGQGNSSATEAEDQVILLKPSIAPVRQGVDRPFWSVMIPTHNPRLQYLEQTVDSILAQDPGSRHMQIELIDDCSSSFDPKDVLKKEEKERVAFYRQKHPAGIGVNWNTCIQRARGHWIHILHQDDFVLPGFYDRLREGIEKEPGIGGAFCQHYSVDSKGQRKVLLSRVEQNEAGILTNWPEYIFGGLSFQTPAVVIKRSVYETVGGFDTSFDYAIDWDMWKRIASQFRFWYDPEPLACWRQHHHSTSRGLTRTGKNIAEIRRSIEASQSDLPPAIAADTTRRAREYYTNHAVRNACELLFDQRDMRATIAQLWEARKLSSSAIVMKKFLKLAMKKWSDERLA